MADIGKTGGAAQGKAAQVIQDPYRLLVENVRDYAIYMLDPDGIVTNWNLGAQRFKGYSRDEIVGQAFSRFFTPSDRHDGLPERILATAAEEGRFEGEGWRVRKDGTRFWSHFVVDTIRDPSGQILGFAKITRDISERRAQEDQLRWLAHYDPLTELPNRLTFRTLLNETISAKRSVTLLMLDLDGFKDVNDTLGHSAGDDILKEVARRIRGCVGENGMVGRLGGDEFAVAVPKLGDPTMAAKICDHLIKTFRVPFIWEEQEAYLGLSIGVAISPNHGRDAEELLSNADLALYRTKSDRSKGYSLFQSSLKHTALARRHCDLELRRAVAENQLKLFFQPLVRLSDYRVTGAEALLRWEHPQRGLITPDAFIDVLEHGRLATTVGEWVIREAVARARDIRERGGESFRINVNLFAAQLRRGQLTAVVTKALEDHGLPPEALELEITENIFLQRGEAMTEPLRKLRELGVGIAFDDYGTGYASLSLLKRFPLSRLKIDRSFIQNLCSDAEDEAVVRAVAYLAESFGLEVTAEGVEHEEQRKRLRELGCESAQGYLFGRPMPVERVMELMDGHEHGDLARWPRSKTAKAADTDAPPPALRA